MFGSLTLRLLILCHREWPSIDSTHQIRMTATILTTVANGDLSKQIVDDIREEMLDLNNTVNSMVSRPLILANEVTRVSLEVGVKGLWKDMTDNVNPLVYRPRYCLL